MVHVPSMTSYLMEGGEFRFPGYLIRHETFEADCIRFMDEIGLQPPDLFRKVNRSAASDERIKECISDKRVVDLVLRLHREDFENFEY